jgi:hypothetical protein
VISLKRSFLYLAFIAFMGSGFIGGIKIAQFLMLREVYEPIAPTHLFEAYQPLRLPALREIIGDATRDAEALDRIVAYYVAHRDQIAANLQEENDTRLKALFVMNIVHISHVYDSVDDPGSFIAYVAQSGSQCALYARYEAEVFDHFGLQWRLRGISGGTHVWVEVNVDGQWEIFDATINTWINRSGEELLQGAERAYRYFYTPMLDEHRQDVFNDYLADAQRLRMLMPGLGLYYHPLALIEAITL